MDIGVDVMRALNKLTAAKVKNAAPGKYSDGGGLWLHKRPDGGAQWFLRVNIHGRRREMGLGGLLHVSLKEWHTHTSLILHHQVEKLTPGAFRLLANLLHT